MRGLIRERCPCGWQEAAQDASGADLWHHQATAHRVKVSALTLTEWMQMAECQDCRVHFCSRHLRKP